MTVLDSLPVLALILWLTAAVMLVVFWRRGFLGSDAFAAAPDRTIGLTMADLAVVVGLFLLGMSAPLALARSMGWIDAEPGQPVSLDLTILQQAGFTLVSQLIAQGPTAAYLFIRTMGTPNGLRRFGFAPRGVRDVYLGMSALVVAIVLVFAVMTLAATVGELIGRPAPKVAHTLLETMRSSDSLLATLLLGFAAVVLAPVLEEIIYRGFVQTMLLEGLGNDRRWLVILIAAAGFALVHLGAVPWHAVPALFTLAVILGWLYERTGSLWPPIIVHAGFNLANSLIALMTLDPST